MIYADAELQRWWAGLAEARRQELLQKMIESAPDEVFCEFAMSLRRQWDVRGSLTAKQIGSIKKWDR